VPVKLLSLFVPVYFAYWGLRGRWRLLLLLAANGAFYLWWDHRLVWVLCASTALNFLCGWGVHRARAAAAKRAWLAASLLGSLGLLAWFKYHGFLAESFVAAAGALGWRVSPVMSAVVLPLGISYYTFQMLSYTMDIHRGVMKPTRSLLVFAVFSSFFAHIIAGPITRARQLIPQLEAGATFDFEHLETGLRRILFGLFKKLFVADTLARHLVDPVFAAPAAYSSPALALALAGYAVQVYADFSGYSSVSIGVARLLGLKLPENFRFPYLALNIADFWRRWHMTLSGWLRDYLWWPLARNVPAAGGLAVQLRAQAALLAVFLLCGLWHRAAWTFVAWGALHGVYMIVYDLWRRWRGPDSPRPFLPGRTGVVVAWLTTQAAVAFGWVLFRADGFGACAAFLRGLVLGTGSQPLAPPPLVWVALLALPVDHLAGFLLEHRPRIRRTIPVIVQAAVCTAMIIFLFHARPEQVNPFIYLRF
jgi:alginate O-acetyltransferase complex protein AlgI